MKKSGLAFIGFMFSIMFLLSSVSAGIYFSDLNSKYNLGDMVDLNVRVDPIIEGRLLNVQLVCGTSVIGFNNFPGEDGDVNIKLPLNFNTINQANGECHFEGNYDGEIRRSMNFEISKKLVVRLGNDAFFANPGETIIVTGVAEKLNGNPVDGEVEITIPLLQVLEVVEEEVVEETEELPSEEVSSSVDPELVSSSVDDNLEADQDATEEEDAGSASEDAESGTEEVVDEEEVVEDEETSEEVEASSESSDSEASTIVDFDAGVFYGKVVSGDFSVSIRIPGNAPAGDFRIDALVYESTDNIRSSEGVSFANLKVFQELRDVSLDLDSQNVDPGVALSVRPKLLDQTGLNIDDEVSVIIRDEIGERFYEKIVKSNEALSYDVPNNFPSGNYEVEASNGEFNVVRNFFVNQKAIVDFELVEDTLVVTNVGNIPYNRAIEFELNGKPFVREVNLEGLGESVSFKLTGEDEEYNVRVSDGNTEITHSGVALTGRVIDVDEIGAGLNLTSPIFWIFFFIILVLILLFLFRNILKKKSVALHNKIVSRKSKSKGHDVKMDSPVSKIENHATQTVPPAEVKKTDAKGNVVHNQADQVLVMKGHKSPAAALVLKVKNKLGENEKKSLEQAMEAVYAKKGAVYEHGDFVFAIFSPLMTKVTNNEALAAGVAQQLVTILNEHNKRYREKIDFGVAINSGQIINKVENGKLKFTAMGNFIVAAKRLAESSNKQVLLSRESFQKAGSQVKGEKVSDGEAYDLRRVVDSEQNNKFIQGFLERQKKN